MQADYNASTVIRRLEDGLILRRSTLADTEKLVKFNVEIHKEAEVGVWTRDLMSGKHPTFGVGDFTIVENPETGEIVSSMNLIDQTWTYAGIPFKVGRPELVGTLPAYRNRGLVRQQFEVIHAWSKQRGQIVQAITGIPYYYRLFGYEMAMDLDGGRMAYASTLPHVQADQPPAYRLRPAVETDIPFIAECYTQNCQRDLIACVWDAETVAARAARKKPQKYRPARPACDRKGDRRANRFYRAGAEPVGEHVCLRALQPDSGRILVGNYPGSAALRLGSRAEHGQY